MKKVMLFLVAMAFFVGTTLVAQPFRNMSAEEFAEIQTVHMKHKLDLTKEQLSKIESLNLKYAEIRKQKRDEVEQARDSRFEEMKKVRDQRYEELQAILTPEQLIKHDEMMKDAPFYGHGFSDKPGNERGHNRGAGNGYGKGCGYCCRR